MSDLLVILDATAAARDEVFRHGTLAHEVSERVFVVRGGEPSIGRLEGVQRVYTGAERDFDLPSGLTPAEAIFVKAWMARERKGPRTGEGADWDAPGFQPPH